ncbi:MAG TPA: pilus assembly protein PilP [Geomonas sp.]
MKKNLNSALLAGLLLLLLLPGCSKRQEAPDVPAPKAAPQAKPAAQPVLPVQRQLSTAVGSNAQLDFKKRTDPFKPFVSIVAAPAKTEQQAARPAADLLPIQSFEVSKFKVAGIIAGLRENRALLIDPNGKGYVVQVGMLIGSHDGRIARISASAVEVVESYREDNGRFRKRKIVLTLAKKR